MPNAWFNVCVQWGVNLVVAEVLTGIALVQQSVKFIKDNISTAQDIGQIASQIDDLFTGEKQVQQARNKKAGGGLGDQFGVDTVAKEIIDARIAAENLQEIATMVDMRFGHGTWAGIVSERAKRIQEAKEAALQVKRQQKKEHDEFMETAKTFAIIAGVIVVMSLIVIAMLVSVAKAFALDSIKYISTNGLDNPVPEIFCKDLACYVDFIPESFQDTIIDCVFRYNIDVCYLASLPDTVGSIFTL